MKKLFLISVILITAIAKGQTQTNRLDLILLQDIKLAMQGHEKTSKDSFTTDIRLSARLNSTQNYTGHWFLAPEIEYADLNIRFIRYSANIGYKFNRFHDEISLSISGGYGLIDREGQAYQSIGIDVFLEYEITKRLSLTLNNQTLERKDVKSKDIVNSFFLGVNIKLFN